MVLSTCGSVGVKGVLEDVILFSDGYTTFTTRPHETLNSSGNHLKLYLGGQNQPHLSGGVYIMATALPTGKDSTDDTIYKITHLITYSKDGQTKKQVYIDGPSGIENQTSLITN